MIARLRSITLLPHSVPRRLTDPIVAILARLGLSPNHLTLLGFAGNVAAAVLAARGDFLAAGAVMLIASALDLLDGALARATGRATPFGAVLDSVFDRLSEAAVLGGLAYYFAGRGDREEVALCVAAITGSIIVSYVRARAQTLGYDLREGWFTRAERVIVLSVGLMIDQVRIVLWVLAVLAGATVLQRMYAVWDRLRDGAPQVKGEEP